MQPSLENPYGLQRPPFPPPAPWRQPAPVAAVPPPAIVPAVDATAKTAAIVLFVSSLAMLIGIGSHAWFTRGESGIGLSGVHECFAHAMQRKQGLLLGCLDGHKPHGRARGGFADGLGVAEVGLVAFDEWFDELRGDQPCLVSERLELAREPMSAGTRLHGDSARRMLGQHHDELMACELPAPELLSTCVLCMNEKEVLAQIDTDQFCVCHDGPLKK